MERLFNYDNKVMQFIGKMVDCFYVSLLWIIFCIPIVTAGASSTAMYYTVHKVLRGGRSYVWSSFWSAFKSNFKQSTIIWIICLLLGVLLGVDAYIMSRALINGDKMGFLYYVFLIIILFFILWMCYLFSYTARFENTTKEIMKNCAMIAIANLPKTVLLAVLLVVAVIIIIWLPFMIFLMPALLTWVMNVILESIYRKYMSPEDLEREKELDMEAKR